MFRLCFALDLFSGEKERDLSRATLDLMLQTLFGIDVLYLRAHPEAPLLYKSGVHYMEEPPGQEEWQDVPTTIAMKSGDCLPLSALVIDSDYHLRPIGTLRIGDSIRADGRWTQVTNTGITGVKPILCFQLSNGRFLRCSPEHRVFRSQGLTGYEEVRAKDLKEEDVLRTPNGRHDVSIVDMGEQSPEVCYDITTDAHEFFLPESDLIVHNCEDLATWRAAELVVRYNIQARPFFKEQKLPDGRYLYHILVRYPDGRIEDPSKILGMR